MKDDFESEEGSFGEFNPFDNRMNSNVNNDNTLADEAFTVNIKDKDGKVFYYAVKPSDKIKTLAQTFKKDISPKNNAQIIFSFQGKILNENKTFWENNIGSDDTLHVLLRLKGGFNLFSF